MQGAGRAKIFEHRWHKSEEKPWEWGGWEGWRPVSSTDSPSLDDPKKWIVAGFVLVSPLWWGFWEICEFRGTNAGFCGLWG